MKKIFSTISFAFTIMLLCFASAFADATGDSGNVDYEGGFAPTSSSDVQTGTTDLTTGISEYTVTFPRSTSMVPFYTKSKRIGKVTVTGEAFIKPYKVAVNITRKNFKLVTKQTRTAYKDDTIRFDVVQLVTDKFGDVTTGQSLLGKTIYYYKDNLKDVVIQPDSEKGKVPVSDDYNGPYMHGEVANINQSLDVGIEIPKHEWATASPGQYRGQITFYAEVDTTNIWPKTQG